ncbi:hypothetical protein LCI18_001274 [Fusarium solani-melongenae]|uniref:Uncharacterized protein n=1 Tax=Fusarium solani subsp. cucurbitae TaxID=2747967 RepID=A0ACD3YN45_FUSSC|nr:hypothetical protein LCI18_001274 [Fusarium solani-melongenae]
MMLNKVIKNPSLALQPDSIYRTSLEDDKTNPQDVFTKATRYLDTLRILNDSAERENIIKKEILNQGSVPAFDGRTTNKTGIEELLAVDQSLRQIPEKELLRQGREVVQHLQAFEYLNHHFVAGGEDLTEDLIKETHAILCNGVSIIDEELPEVLSEMYAGRYRNVAVGAGSTMMKELCSSLKEEIQNIATQGYVDPFSLAAKHSLQFVDIHPFQDGNGRMCRMILNVILRRYLGIVVAIEETDEDVREYIGIKKRASMEMEGHGEYATFVLKRGQRRYKS